MAEHEDNTPAAEGTDTNTDQTTGGDEGEGTILPKTTKMDVATEIYKRMRRQRNVTRKDIIAKFVAEADLSIAAASTYYQIIKARQEKK